MSRILSEDKNIERIVFVNGYVLRHNDFGETFKVSRFSERTSFFISTRSEKAILVNQNGVILEIIEDNHIYDFSETQVLYVKYQR